ncbi:class I mannose-6-phosphate isomerase [Pseudalkalibacillus sp. A8]|uniref:class I mannose-6-phosphate isomerase n=1 Tax=Pseudalkalibacillus sp. A8 TaxID=3382641 RepID=UPI0038B61D7E
MTTYDKYPEINVNGKNLFTCEGYEKIVTELQRKLTSFPDKQILVIDCYPGVRYQEILNDLIEPLKPDLLIHSDDLAYSGEEISEKIQRNLTDDRVFGVLSCHRLEEFFDENKVGNARENIENIQSGLVVIYGVGASLVHEPNILMYLDLARWEIQQRYRSKEIGNWKMENIDEDILRKYKRGYFVEWRVADRHKKTLFERMDFLLDTNKKNSPKMISGEAFLEGLKQAVNRPFRLVPYFDAGVWGGQWMKEVCDLNREQANYAWSFDGVPEENSIYLKYGDIKIEVPSLNLVFRHPTELLGDKVHARFGTEFPIRFDYLDTMGGSNLSLQVHPLTEYIQENFGVAYTQDESYYYMQAKEDATIYLGLKEGVDKEELIRDLKRAAAGEITFPDEKYINRIPAKKHDHFLIPAGTVHCGGANGVILEISATPYIFTFKLWDWGRVGLDGLPRPVHIEHGEKNIIMERDEVWVERELVNQIEKIEEGEGWVEERTGLHSTQFIETRRHWFTDKVTHHTNGSVNMMNLIEGDEVVITSPENTFEPFYVHYGETFIIPENVKVFEIAPSENAKAKEFATIKAYVR